MSTIVTPPLPNANVSGVEPHRRTTRGLGWVPDLPDQRDHLFAAHPQVLANLPPSVDLRPKCPPVYDQLQLGSCTANAIAGLFEFVATKESFGTVMPSRLFIYWNERQIEGTVGTDSGAQLRDGIKAVAKLGVCKEADWAYDISKFTDKPGPPCYKEALQSRAIQYLRLSQTPAQLKGCLAQGYPFVFGFTVYTSFMSDAVAKSGVGTLPQAGDTVEGGHAVVAVGYDDSSQTFIIRNSWGESWGMSGYFTFPYAYLTSTDLSSDFWTIQQVEAAAKVPQPNPSP